MARRVPVRETRWLASFNGPTAYTSKSVVNTRVEGKPERMTMDQAGKWLAADCGAVKPIKR